MAVVDGLMTVTTRSVPESNNVAGLMIMDRQALIGLMRFNSSFQPLTSLMGATGLMEVNYSNAAGLQIMESN